MKTNQTHDNSNFIARLHPLVTVAAASVIVVSLLGVAALTGMLPSSRANVPAELTVSDQAQAKEQSSAPKSQKTLGHPTSTQHSPPQVVAASPASTQTSVAQPPVQAAPAPKNSALGIGVGAVVGGLLGNQVGSGDGKTLATIAGAVGGGYVGNEIAKKNQ